MMEKALKRLIGTCRIPMKRVIFFRDGVAYQKESSTPWQLLNWRLSYPA
jgi:hypothetical protein